MAIYRWRGDGAGTKTNWQDGRNWMKTDGTYHAQLDYPSKALGDEAWFDSALTGTMVAPSTNIDLTAQQQLLRLLVSKQYDGTLGSSGAPVKFDMQATNTTEVLIDGQETLAMGLQGVGTNGLYRVTVLDSATSLWLGGKLGNVSLLKGTAITIDNAVSACDALTMGYIDARTADANVTIESGATLPGTVKSDGGTVTCAQAITTLHLSGGQWTQTEGTITTAFVYGGTLYWGAAEPTTTIPGNITTIYLFGGTVDGSDNLQQRSCTLAIVYKGATLNVDNGMRNITVTQYEYQGGEFGWTLGQRLTKYS